MQRSKTKTQNFLEKVIQKKREDFYSSSERSESRSSKAVVLDFARTIIDAAKCKKVAVIAEVKFASPTNPNLGSPSELLSRVKAYEKAGADAISIITEKHVFKGDIAFVSRVKKVVKIPVLQKDFVIDEKQIHEAKSAGSDALLLIARLVSKEKLQAFVLLTQKLGIEPVVEVFDDKDLQKAVATKTRFIAVNARDLETFVVDVDKACKLMKKIPDRFIKLGFSGIHSKAEVEQYKRAGAKGVLVGTSLMKTKNISEFISSLRAKRSNLIHEQRLPRLRQLADPRNDKNAVKVKICGIRTVEAAMVAVEEGADFLGFNFVPSSKRYIEPGEAKKIIQVVQNYSSSEAVLDRAESRSNSSRLTPFARTIKIVGVFQNEKVEEVNKIADLLGLDFVQLHGEEDNKYIKKMKKPVIKSFTLHPMPRSLERGSIPCSQSEKSKCPDRKVSLGAGFTLLDNPQDIDAKFILLDRVNRKGEMVDLEKAAELAQQFTIFLAGGLTPKNVAEVVTKVRSFAVDVAGGVEANGEQDLGKIKEFIQNAKQFSIHNLQFSIKSQFLMFEN